MDDKLKNIKSIEDIPLEARNKIPEYRERCVKDLYSGKEYENFNPEETVKYIEYVYQLAQKPKPVVVFAQNPLEYKIMFEILLKKEKLIDFLHAVKNDDPSVKDMTKKQIAEKTALLEKETDNYTKEEILEEVNKSKTRNNFIYLLDIYSRIYLSWYKFIQQELGVVTEKDEELNWLYDHCFNNINNVYVSDKYILVLRIPKKIFRNESGFHNTEGPAIEWEDYGLYYINGRKMPDEIFQGFTRDEFIKEEDEEVRAGMYEILMSKGEEYMKEFLDVYEADIKEIIHENGDHEILTLFKTNFSIPEASDALGNTNVPLAWIKFICPSTGQSFMQSTSSHFTNALEAAKNHRPEGVPLELIYSWNSRS